jgi:hypothetical protein
MRQPGNAWKALWLVGSAFALLGCGGSGDGNGSGAPANGDGTVTEAWAGYCTGTFTEDTPITDFDRTIFTARTGDEFLMSDFSDSFGGRAAFLYLTSDGPDTFEVEARADATWPFTSNCSIGKGVPYYGVFKGVSVFAEKELTTKLCDLSAGDVLPAGSSGRGYSLAGSSNGATIYQVILGPFAEQCGGQDKGYVRVSQTQSFGSTTWLVPIAGLIGPD